MEKVAVDPARSEDSLGREANLPSISVAGSGHGRRDLIQVSIRHDDQRTIGTQFHRNLLMPAMRQIRSPISRLPVKVILRTRRSETSTSPISPPEPVRHWIPSGGSPASSKISVSFRAESGVSVAGLTTTELPAASAGPTL